MLFSYSFAYLLLINRLGKLDKFVSYDLFISKRIVYVLLIVVMIIYLPWIGVDRYIYKESVGFWPGEVLIAASMLLYLLGVRGTSREKVFVIAIFFVIIFAIREREYILFLVALVWFSLKQTRSRVALVILGITSILFYKSFFNYVTGSDNPTFLFDDILHFLRFSAADARHALNIMYSYMLGDNPSYLHQSIYYPHWIRNVFGDSLISNSRLASEYYTANMTGTGFNHALELWLNFGLYLPVFCVLFTVVLLVLARLGPLFIVPVLTFIIKSARGDFSAVFVVWVVIPTLILLSLYLFDRYILKALLDWSTKFWSNKNAIGK